MLGVIAFRNLRQGGRRTSLLGIALALVTGLLVTLMSLSNGINDSLVRAATTLAAGHINIAGFYKAAPKESAPIVTEMAAIKALAAKNTPGLRSIIDRHRGWAKAISDTGSMWAGLYGIDVTAETALLTTLQVAAEDSYMDGGRAEKLGDPLRLNEPDTLMMFASQARRLGVTVGDRITIRTETLRGMSNTVDLEIVAVMQNIGMMSNWNLFLPKQTILDLYGLEENSTGAIMLYLDDIDQSPAVMDHLRKVLEGAGYTVMDHDPRPFFTKFEIVSGQDWTGQQLDLTTWDDEVSFMSWVITAIDSISFLLVVVLAIIIAIGIMNAMWIAVRERTREIGTLRAIGMSRNRVLAMFLIEAAVLGLIATTVGAAVSVVGVLALDASAIEIPVEAIQGILMSDTLHFVVSPLQIVLAIVGFTAFAALASVWPALRAARLPPITAIQRTE